MNVSAVASVQGDAQRSAAQVQAIQSGARDRSEAGLRAAAEAFESYFLQVMWGEMRKTIQDGGLIEKGFAHDVFQGMLDQAMSETSAQAGGIGLANMLVAQLSARGVY